MLTRFGLGSTIVDGQSLKKIQKQKGKSNPLSEPGIYISSHNFAYRYDYICKEIAWDLIVIDEAHRLRNVWRKGNKTAKKIRDTLKGRPKVLLTATPLQNNLMELYGLASFLEENYLGTEFSFKTLFVNPVTRHKKFDHLSQLKERLMGTFDSETGEYKGGVLTRTLRNQVRGLIPIPFTNRHCITEDFAPNDDEIELYNNVSDYLRRPFLASTRATQRHMMELVYRKILASSSFAISGTLEKVADFLSKRLQLEFNVNFDEILKHISEIKTELEQKWKRKLSNIKINNFRKKSDSSDEHLPGLEDLEVTLDKLEEEDLDTDDLHEEEEYEGEATSNKSKKIISPEREIDHVFTKQEVLQEFSDVLSYFFLSTTISKNQKSQALIRVLSKVFQFAEKRSWPQKAVIFTESRRTQDHLERLLNDLGYNLVLFNGSNASHRSREIYEEWADRYPKEASEGARSINIRKALVWKFKELEKAILITTEAGAEGLNLQFANIVVNYDLPWNPQRVEQRIGRCHRYGQKLDVLVINFLNKRNYADQRVYELLSEKIKLFGNLFNFSDRVLGTEELTDDGYEVREVALAGLGTGLDFERKILSIYRACRTEAEIEKSFKQLQLELSEIIEEKIQQTQKKVIQHFDSEVRQKLRLRQQKLSAALSKKDLFLKTYLSLIYGSKIRFEPADTFQFQDKQFKFGKLSNDERDQGFISVHPNLDFIKERIEEDKRLSGFWKIAFAHPKDTARKYFEEFIGNQGQLALYLLRCNRKTINNNDEVFDKLVISSIIKDGDDWRKLPTNRAERLFDLNIIDESHSTDGKVHDFLTDIANKNIHFLKETILKENEDYIVQEMDLLNQFVEESLLQFRQDIETREKEIKEIRHRLRASKTSGHYEMQQIQEEIDKKQKDLFKAQKKYIQAQESQFHQKDKKVIELKNKLQMSFEIKKLAEVQFTIRE